MSMPEKFLFDTSFESDDADGSRAPADKKRAAPKFHEEDLEKSRAEGFAAGKETGERDAMQTIEQQVSQALGAISTQLGGLSQAQIQANEQQTREALETALTVVRRLFPHLADRHGLAEIEAVICDCLERLQNEPRIVIRVADPLLDRIEERVGALVARVGFDGKIVFLSQENLQPGDVRVEWADGGAERDSDQLWRQVEQLIARIIGPTRRPAETAEAPPDPSPEKEATTEPACAGPVPDGAAVSA